VREIDSVSSTPLVTSAPVETIRAQMVARAQKLVSNPLFDVVTTFVILVNAVVIGLETFGSFNDRHEDTLVLLNEICFGYYVVELSIRMISYFPRPWRFFGEGWNVFDFVIVFAVVIPGVRENAQLLRILRILRVTRLVRMLKDLRIVVNAIGRAVPGVASLGLAAILLVYVYGMIGWIIFGEDDPGFANIGEAMLTMFEVLTLENLPDFIDTGRAITGWAIPFYVSYALFASFIVFNLFIGIVLNSMEEARNEELRRHEAELLEGEPEDVEEAAARMAVHERVRNIREELQAIESDLAAMERADEHSHS
jgi:voltage-gated sodium channel